MPTPLADSSSRVIQVFSGRTAVPHPTQHSVSAAGGLPEPYANETSSGGFDCRSGEGGGGQKGVQRSQAGGKLDQLPGKMYWAPLQQCFAAVTWSVLYVSGSEDLTACVPRRLKCTQVRWQISGCAWFYFYKRHWWGLAILIHCGNRQGMLPDFHLPLTSLFNLLNVGSIWNVGILFQWNNAREKKLDWGF